MALRPPHSVQSAPPRLPYRHRSSPERYSGYHPCRVCRCCRKHRLHRCDWCARHLIHRRPRCQPRLGIAQPADGRIAVATTLRIALRHCRCSDSRFLPAATGFPTCPTPNRARNGSPSSRFRSVQARWPMYRSRLRRTVPALCGRTIGRFRVRLPECSPKRRPNALHQPFRLHSVQHPDAFWRVE